MKSTRNISRSLADYLLAFFVMAATSFYVAAQEPAANSAHAMALHNNQKVMPGQVLIKYRNRATPESVAQLAQNADADSDEEVGSAGVHLIHSRSKNVATLVRELSARADVAYAEPNYIIHVDAVPNDPQFSQLYALRNTTTPGVDIGATSAWDVSTGARANVVAVIDTGVAYNHPDLTTNMWSAPAPFTVNIGGKTIQCAAGTHGFNAINKHLVKCF